MKPLGPVTMTLVGMVIEICRTSFQRSQVTFDHHASNSVYLTVALQLALCRFRGSPTKVQLRKDEGMRGRQSHISPKPIQ